MMGRIDNQMQLLILDLDSMIPENHLLRQIKNSVNFDFIYEKASSFYDKDAINWISLWNQIRTQIGRGSFFKFSISMVL